MPRTIMEPMELPSDRTGAFADDKRYQHPAYGQVTISQVHCSPPGEALYGSDMMHDTYVQLQIHTSELSRHLSRDCHFTKDCMISVALSNAQFVRMLTSMGKGEGVTCTIQHTIADGVIPGIPRRDAAAEHKPELTKAAEGVYKDLMELRNEIEENTVGLSKVKQGQLLAKVSAAAAKVKSTMPFVAGSFMEAMEKREERAKTEINTYIDMAVRQVGLDALASFKEEQQAIAAAEPETKQIEAKPAKKIVIKKS